MTHLKFALQQFISKSVKLKNVVSKTLRISKELIFGYMTKRQLIILLYFLFLLLFFGALWKVIRPEEVILFKKAIDLEKSAFQSHEQLSFPFLYLSSSTGSLLVFAIILYFRSRAYYIIQRSIAFVFCINSFFLLALKLGVDVPHQVLVILTSLFLFLIFFCILIRSKKAQEDEAAAPKEEELVYPSRGGFCLQLLVFFVLGVEDQFLRFLYLDLPRLLWEDDLVFWFLLGAPLSVLLQALIIHLRFLEEIEPLPNPKVRNNKDLKAFILALLVPLSGFLIEIITSIVKSKWN